MVLSNQSPDLPEFNIGKCTFYLLEGIIALDIQVAEEFVFVADLDCIDKRFVILFKKLLLVAARLAQGFLPMTAFFIRKVQQRNGKGAQFRIGMIHKEILVGLLLLVYKGFTSLDELDDGLVINQVVFREFLQDVFGNQLMAVAPGFCTMFQQHAGDLPFLQLVLVKELKGIVAEV